MAADNRAHQDGERLGVAMVAPPWFELPPDGYGGIEAMVYWLAEALNERGHQVTLISAGEPAVSSGARATYRQPPSERLGEPMPEAVHALVAAEHLAELDVDVVHDHSLAGPLTARGRGVPTVVTAHGPIEGDLADYYAHLGPDVHLVAISEFQRSRAPELPWAGVVHNAIPIDEYPLRTDKEDFCLFLGRVNGEKAPDLAIEAARAAGRRIVIAAKCNEPDERRYFEERVQPLLGDDAEWLGTAGTEEKKDLLARAACLVFPIQWDEPFGLVMVEAMACGTPVVALRRGSVPEVVADGVSGFVRDRLEELPQAIERVGELDPAECRRQVAGRFDVPTMADGYEGVYRRLVAPA
ncbi:MAG TPA: glycosyltransferase family 4 protein [Actinomycetes bacterium]